MPENNPATVIVALPDGVRSTWFGVAQILQWHGRAACVPQPGFAVRHRPVLGWFTRWNARNLLDGVRRHGAVTRAAGGRVSRLDLPAMTTLAHRDAAQRWRAWNTHVGRRTSTARTWESFHAEHLNEPTKLPLAEARRRFEAQPRVLAMLAYACYPMTPLVLDPYELEAYQAGETVYVALHRQRAVAGDALITPDGILLQPDSPSPADRLRYYAKAAQVINALHKGQHLVAVQAASLP